MSWQLNDTDKKLIELALTEDLGMPYCDLTSSLLFPEARGVSQTVIISKQPSPIVVSGLNLIQPVLNRLSQGTHVTYYCQDGDLIQPGDRLVKLRGPANALLMAERTLLNFLQHLSAIATPTHQYVQAVKHTDAKILDTRKTIPGFRHLDKYAITCGGGCNHRMGLYDAVMVKDTHIDFLGGIEKTLTKLPTLELQKTPVIVEVRSIEELATVRDIGRNKVSRVLLDNLSLSDLKKCVDFCRGWMTTEASGNISLDTVSSVASTDVDFISIGKLTHSAGNVDLSMKSEYALCLE